MNERKAGSANNEGSVPSPFWFGVKQTDAATLHKAVLAGVLLQRAEVLGDVNTPAGDFRCYLGDKNGNPVEANWFWFQPHVMNREGKGKQNRVKISLKLKHSLNAISGIHMPVVPIWVRDAIDADEDTKLSNFWFLLPTEITEHKDRSGGEGRSARFIPDLFFYFEVQSETGLQRLFRVSAHGALMLGEQLPTLDNYSWAKLFLTELAMETVMARARERRVLADLRARYVIEWRFIRFAVYEHTIRARSADLALDRDVTMVCLAEAGLLDSSCVKMGRELPDGTVSLQVDLYSLAEDALTTKFWYHEPISLDKD